MVEKSERGPGLATVLALAAVLLAGSPFPASAAPAPAPQQDTRAPAARVADPVQAGDYEIGVEDRLRIHVWEDETLASGAIYVVRPDGWITVPLADEIRAAGRTPSELRDEIRRKLVPFIPTPTVTVIVEEARSFRFFVLGEVKSQGVFQVGTKVRVLQALALAGGLSEFADKDNIILVRNLNGDEIRLRLAYRKILAGDPDHDVWIRPGDTLVVN